MNRLRQHCTDCPEGCGDGCCCSAVEFQVCADLSDCTAPDVTPPTPPNCMYVGTLFFGWAAVPQCILDMADGGTITYDIFLHECPADMTGTPDFTVTNPVEVVCPTPAFGIGRVVWAPNLGADCTNCLPDVCLRISADGVFLTRCTVCPELCDIQCSSSSSSSSGSSESSESSSSSGSSESSGSPSSSSGSPSSSSSGDDSSSSSSSSSSGESSSSSSSSSSSESSGSPSESSSSSGSGDSSSSSSGSGDSSSSSSGCACFVQITAQYNPETESIVGEVLISCGCECADSGDITISDDVGNEYSENAPCDITYPFELYGNYYPEHAGESIEIFVAYGACNMSCGDSVRVFIPF